MSRQNNQPRSDRKNEGQRKENQNNAVRSYRNQQGGSYQEDRNRPDNTRIEGLDKYRLNDLYERSSF